MESITDWAFSWPISAMNYQSAKVFLPETKQDGVAVDVEMLLTLVVVDHIS